MTSVTTSVTTQVKAEASPQAGGNNRVVTIFLLSGRDFHTSPESVQSGLDILALQQKRPRLSRETGRISSAKCSLQRVRFPAEFLRKSFMERAG